MKRIANLSMLAFLAAILMNCETKQGQSESEYDTGVVDLGEGEQIGANVEPKASIEPFTGFIEYPDAQLEWAMPEGNIEAGDTKFSYDVTNYELGVPTPDQDEHPLATSDKGQHIHLILNNAH